MTQACSGWSTTASPRDLTARLFGLAHGLLELDTAKKSRLPGYFCGTPALPVKELS